MARHTTSNPVVTEEGVTYLLLNKGQRTAIDPADLPNVGRFHWHVFWNESVRKYYARASMPSARNPCGTTTVYLHRWLMGEPPGRLVDHRDTDTLNNRRGNLRVVTNQQNMENRSGQSNTNSKTGVRGVSVHKCRPSGRMYCARVNSKGRKPLARYFPYTPEGFSAACVAILEMRAQVQTHSDGR